MIRSLFRAFRGWWFGLSILTTSMFGTYIICLLLILVFIGQHRLWRSIMDRAVSFWMMIPMGFLEFIFGMNMIAVGDEIDINQPGLILMNHRTRLDWMYSWSLLYQMNPWLITTNKISLKAQLKKLPGAGFGMSTAHFVFLERDLEKDRLSFDKAIEYYKGMRQNYQVLLFPEGTDKSPWTTTKSSEYAKKNGLRQLNHLLYPRTSGFYHLITKMRQEDYVSYVYDITIAFPYNIVQSEVDLVLKGACPREVHYHIRKISIAEVPKGQQELAEWLQKVWVEKEARLEKFYAEPIKSKRFFETKKGDITWSTKRESWLKRIVKLCSLCFWLSIIAVCAYHITFLTLFQCGCMYTVVVTLSLYGFYGGIDNYVYEKWKNSRKTAIV